MDQRQSARVYEICETQRMMETQAKIQTTQSTETIVEVIDASFSKISPYIFVPVSNISNSLPLNETQTSRHLQGKTSTVSSKTKKRSSTTTKRMLKRLQEARAVVKTSNSVGQKIKRIKKNSQQAKYQIRLEISTRLRYFRSRRRLYRRHVIVHIIRAYKK